MAERTNEQIVLGTVLAQKRAEVAPGTEADDYFEIFASEQVLRAFDLLYEEIELGLVDGGDDGGIDGFFVFVNGQLMHEDTDHKEHRRKDLVLEVDIVQSKNQETFRESPVEKLAGTLRDLLNLDVPLSR
jgi:hypothetical protein